MTSVYILVSVRALLKAYDWKHASVIYDTHGVFYREAGPSMITDFDEDPDFPSAYPVEFNRTDQWNPKDVLVDASRHTRGTHNGKQSGA